jgi:hypothetical protein
MVPWEQLRFHVFGIGYYRDGRYERTYYTLEAMEKQLQRQRPLVGPFWAREFETAHKDIDDDY